MLVLNVVFVVSNSFTTAISTAPVFIIAHLYALFADCHALNGVFSSMYLSYLCPPSPLYNSLLHIPHPPLLPFVIFFFFASSSFSSLPSFSIILSFLACWFTLNNYVMFKCLNIINPLPKLIFTTNFPFIHTFPYDHPPTVTDLRMKARRSSLPPTNSVICHIASYSHERQGTGLGNKHKVEYSKP